jgi:uncharacterized protein with ParB-like and HNH nuclease domain
MTNSNLEQLAKDDREALKAKLDEIINPLERPSYTCDFGMLKIRRNIVGLLDDESKLELIPDFQRGVVWTTEKQIYFVECMLRNLLPQSAYNMTFNMPYFLNTTNPNDGHTPTRYQNFVCVDGLQRFTAIENFINGEFKVFNGQIGVNDLLRTAYDLNRKTFTINVFEYDTDKDILNLYLNMNTGGIAHADSEIVRVREMLAQCD